MRLGKLLTIGTDLFLLAFFAYWTLVAYGKITRKPKANMGVYDRTVGKYDVDLVSKSRKILRWLGPCLIIFYLVQLIQHIGVF